MGMRKKGTDRRMSDALIQLKKQIADLGQQVQVKTVMSIGDNYDTFPSESGVGAH